MKKGKYTKAPNYCYRNMHAKYSSIVCNIFTIFQKIITIYYIYKIITNKEHINYSIILTK